jgi:hypothetical protein
MERRPSREDAAAAAAAAAADDDDDEGSDAAPPHHHGPGGRQSTPRHRITSMARNGRDGCSSVPAALHVASMLGTWVTPTPSPICTGPLENTAATV